TFSNCLKTKLLFNNSGLTNQKIRYIQNINIKPEITPITISLPLFRFVAISVVKYIIPPLIIINTETNAVITNIYMYILFKYSEKFSPVIFISLSV
ncbi:MAG: hypothetical protein QM532_01910, partial [Cyanobium sp. MAG06]|nr:hypothetical protein [Cyanobium sp. MAG06]